MKNSKISITSSLLLLMFALRTSESWGCASSFYDPSVFNTILPEEISLFSSELGKDTLFSEHAFITHPRGEMGTDQNGSSDHSPKCLGRYCEESSIATEQTTNLREWKNYLKTQASNKALSELIYQIDDHSLETGRTTLRNPVFQELIKRRKGEVIDYLVFAKKCEKANNIPDPWGPRFHEPLRGRNPQLMKQLIEKGIAQYHKTADKFLKLRYAFQITRLANYAEEYDLSIQYYDQFVAPLKSQDLYAYQALRHKAGAYLNKKMPVEAIKIWVQVFDQSAPLMNRILYNDFFLPEPSVWEEVLKNFEGQKHHQATLWGLRALHENNRIDLRPLQEMVRLEPKSSRTEFFLVRYINMLEVKLLTYPYLTGENESVEIVPYLKDFHQFLQSVDKTIVRRPALWHLALAHTSMLLKKNDQALVELELATKTTGTSPLLALQAQLIQGFAKTPANSRTPLNLDDEKHALQVLVNLQKMPPQYNWTTLNRSYLLFLTRKYLLTGAIAKSYFTLSKTGYPDLTLTLLTDYTTPEEIQKMIDLIQKKQKSAFESWITDKPLFSTDDLYSIKATKSLALEEFAAAEVAMKQIKGEIKDRKDVTTSFKDNFYRPSTGLYDRDRSEFPKLTRGEFVKTVNDLVNKTKSSPADAAKSFFQLGNGFFHYPFWRYYHSSVKPWENSRYRNHPLFEGYTSMPKSIFKDVDPKPHSRIFAREDFHLPENNRYLAWKFYDQAMTLSQDPELAARSCFMAAAVQKEFAYAQGFIPPHKDILYYYELLKNKYADTKFYSEVVKECLSFKNYLGKKH